MNKIDQPSFSIVPLSEVPTSYKVSRFLAGLVSTIFSLGFALFSSTVRDWLTIFKNVKPLDLKVEQNPAVRKADSVRSEILPAHIEETLVEGLEPLSLRALYNLHAGEFGKNSKYEGGQSKVYLDYLVKYFAKRKEIGLQSFGLTDQHIELLKKASEIDGRLFSADDVNKLKNFFLEQKQLLIPCGWMDERGHAIFFECLQQPNGKVLLRIYNYGEGAEQHDFLEVNYKEKATFLQFEDVDINTLFSPKFFQILYELQHPPREGDGIRDTHLPYNKRDIYTSLRELFQLEPTPFSQEQGEDLSLLFSLVQGMGNCSWKSFAGYLKNKMKAEFYNFKSHFLLQTLYDFALSLNPPSKEDWYFVSKALKHLGKYDESHKYTLRPFEKEIKTLQEWVKKHDSLRYHQIVEESQIANPIYPNSEGISLPRANVVQFHEVLHQNVTDVTFPGDIYNMSFDAFHQKLTEVKDQGAKDLAHIMVYEWVKKIPENSEDCLRYFLNVDKEKLNDKSIQAKALQIIPKITEVLKIYTQGFYLPQNPFLKTIEEMQISVKLIAVQRHLMELSSEKSKKRSHFFTNFNNLFDPSLLRLINQDPFYNIQTDLMPNINNGKVKWERVNIDQMKPYLEEFLKTNPSFKDNTRGTSPRKMYAKLFAEIPSSHWIGALRDAYLLLYNEYLIYQKSFNNEYFDCHYIVEGSDDQVKVKADFIDMVDNGENVLQTFEKHHQEAHNLIHKSKGPEKEIFSYINHASNNEPEIKTSEDLKKYQSTQELAHLGVGEQVKILDTLAYFNGHLESMQDIEKQIYLSYLLITKEIEESSPLVKAKLATFLENSYQFFSKNHLYQPAIFCLSLAKRLHLALPDESFMKDHENLLRDMLNRVQHKPEIKALVYYHLLQYYKLEEELTNDQTLEMLKALTYLQNVPISNSLNNPQLDLQIRRLKIRYSSTFSNFMRQGQGLNQEALNAIAKDLTPQFSSEKWKYNSKTQSFSSKSGQFSLQTLQFLHLSNSKYPIPYEITSQKIFQELYTGVEEAQWQDNKFLFTDKHGRKTRVSFDPLKGINIEQLFDKEWLTYIDSKTFLKSENVSQYETILPTYKSALGNRFITENYSIFYQPSSKKTYFVDRKSGKIFAKTSLNENSSITNDRNYQLTIPFEPFTSFEDPNYILSWKKGSQLEVEIPRFNILFKKTKNGWESRDYPGFVLEIPLKEPLKELGGFKTFLVLKNDQGERFAIIPKQKFVKLEKPESLTPHYILNQENQNIENPQQNYVLFPIKDNSIQLPSNLEDTLYLTLISAIGQNYIFATDLLKKIGQKLSAYSEKEKAILTQLANLTDYNGEQSSDSIAIRNYASFLLLKNGFYYDNKTIKPVLNQAFENYKFYLNRLSRLTLLPLTKEEEIFVISMLGDLASQKMHNRLKNLHGKPSSEGSITQPKRPHVIEQYIDKIESPFFNVRNQNRPPFPLSITRPNFYHHFATYYKMAKEGNDHEKQFLQDAIKFSKYQEPRERNAALILFAALHAPDKFPPQFNPYEINFIESVLDQTKSLFKSEGFPKPDFLSPIASTTTIVSTNPTSIDKKIEPISLKKANIPTLKQKFLSFFKEVKTKPKKNTQKFSEWIDKEKATLTNPSEKKEWQRLQDEKSVLEQETKQYTLSVSKSELEKKLTQEQTTLNKELTDKKSHLVNLLNRFKPGKSYERLTKTLTGKFVETSFNKFLLYFAQNDPSLLLKDNPDLDSRDIAFLFQETHLYLVKSIQLQQIEKGLEALKNKKQNLADFLLTEPNYETHKSPSSLVFEYFSNMLIREEQQENIQAFFKDEGQNLIKQMIMGAGKTSVLLPLILLIKAKSGKLSCCIVPDSLLNAISTNTQNVFKNTFGKNIQTLQFERDTPFTLSYLKVLEQQLATITQNKEPIILTNGSFQNFFLKTLEKIQEFSKTSNKQTYEEFCIMRNILLKFKIDAIVNAPLADEIDKILQILTQRIFSLNQTTGLQNDERWLIQTIYSTIYQDGEIKQKFLIETDPSPNTQAPTLTLANYPEFKTVFIQKFIQRMENTPLTDKSSLHEKKFVTFIKNLSPIDKAKLINYLERKNIQEGQEYYDQLEDDIKNMIALLGQEANVFLRDTLLRSYDENYGTNKPGLYAIPFKSAGNPTPNSQFSNAAITANYTFQNYFKKGIGVQDVKELIRQLQQEALYEMQQSKGDLTETNAWQKFQLITGDLDVPLFDLTELNYSQIKQTINGNFSQLSEIISSLIVTKIETSDQLLACNAINFVSLFGGNLSGFTGTLWNAKTMHADLNPVATKGTDTLTLETLWRKQQKVLVASEHNSQSLLQLLAKQKVGADMIIDAGGYCKDQTNPNAFAKKLATQFKTPVVYYNQKGKIKKTQKVDEQESLHFIDQTRIEGANHIKKPTAKGFVTIGKNMIFRDLLQAVGRLRGLRQDQQVQFIISKEVESLILQELKKAGPVTFNDIIKFVIANQKRREEIENTVSFEQQLNNIPQQIFLNILFDPHLTENETKELIRQFGDLWFKSGYKTPHELYGQLAFTQDNSEYIKIKKRQCFGQIEKIFSSELCQKLGLDKNFFLQKVEEIIKQFEGALPQHLSQNSGKNDGLGDEIVEVQTQNQKESVSEMENEVATVHTNHSFATLSNFPLPLNKEVKEFDISYITNYKKNDPFPVFSLSSYFAQFEEYKDCASYFKDVAISSHLFNWEYKDLNNLSKDTFRFFGKFKIPMKLALIEEDKIIFLSKMEAKGYEKNPKLYHLEMGFCNKEEDLSDEQLLTIVKGKFLDGQSTYTKRESALLENWLKSSNPQALYNFFVNVIIKDSPLKRDRFKNSILESIFNTI